MKELNIQKIQNKLRNKFLASGVNMPGPETIFFFKQKTAYEIGVRLVGSEMCIRDSIDLPIKAPAPLPTKFRISSVDLVG